MAKRFMVLPKGRWFQERSKTRTKFKGGGGGGARRIRHVTVNALMSMWCWLGTMKVLARRLGVTNAGKGEEEKNKK